MSVCLPPYVCLLVCLFPRPAFPLSVCSLPMPSCPSKYVVLFSLSLLPFLSANERLSLVFPALSISLPLFLVLSSLSDPSHPPLLPVSKPPSGPVHQEEQLSEHGLDCSVRCSEEKRPGPEQADRVCATGLKALDQNQTEPGTWSPGSSLSQQIACQQLARVCRRGLAVLLNHLTL